MAQAGGVADISVQGYYLGGNSQPLTALSGLNISFREYLPSLGFITGNFEGYDDSARGRSGQNYITLHNLKWKSRKWTITGGDFRFRTVLVPLPFTNYSYPEIGVRGARVEMFDGRRQYTVFWGEETLQQGPRITFRTRVPQNVLGAVVHQRFGERLQVGVRYLGLTSGEQQITPGSFFFPTGSEFRRTDSVSLQSSYALTRGLSLFADATLTSSQFAAAALYSRAVPVSWLFGGRWQTKRLVVTANYGRLSRAALPVVGYYFGDRKGPYAEVRYKPFGSVELFGSALHSENNLEKNPNLANFATNDVTGGANAILPGKIGVSAQYSKIGLTGEQASDPAQNQRQHSSQAQLSLNRTAGRHNLTATARDLDLVANSYRQKQKSAEIQDAVQFSRFGFGGALRGQQQSGSGQLQNSIFVRGMGQIRLRRFSAYGQYETGNDLINKTLFAANSVNTTVVGASIPVMHGWTVQAEAFRTTLLAALNPASILVLQSQGTGVSDILSDFNQWSFFLRLSHRKNWGAPLPEAQESNGNDVVYGAVEGFVYDGGTGASGISVQMDKSRTATTDASGRYRFEDVPEGNHQIEVNLADLAADLSPSARPAPVSVKPRGSSRVDLRVLRAGSAIRGAVTGLEKDDRGIVRLENIVIDIVAEDAASGTYTTCDSGGEFGFYNLRPGKYRVSLDKTTLPEFYVLVSETDLTVELSASGSIPILNFRMEKRLPQLPVRKVFESEAVIRK